MTVSHIIRAYKSTKESGYCESRILQILLSQFDSGRGLQNIKKNDLIYFSLSLGNNSAKLQGL